MLIEIGYNLDSLQESARYIWENNPAVPRWPSPPADMFDLMKQMKEHVRRDVKKNLEVLKREKEGGVNLSDLWTNMTGTGGYTILYSLEDDTDERIYISVEFLVDPAVGKNGTFVTETLDFED
jgi:hypothetical protein